MTLIALIDRVRMLDNDLIRLNAKLDMILQEQERNEAASNSTTKSKSKFSKSGK
jgi:hypothetical protein